VKTADVYIDPVDYDRGGRFLDKSQRDLPRGVAYRYDLAFRLHIPVALKDSPLIFDNCSTRLTPPR